MSKNGGMGMRKHIKSGNVGKSPKFRLHLKREAEKKERKGRESVCKFSSISEAFKV